MFTLLVKGDYLIAGFLTIGFIILFLVVYVYTEKQPGLNWELLLEKDLQRLQGFYRIANMFTDVPHLKGKTKSRRLITRLLGQGTYAKENAYTYLYQLSFLRSGDYFGMFMRLTLIGAVVIYIMPHPVLKILFALLFLYISNLQSMTLYQHHRTNIWLDLYPLQIADRQKAVIGLLMKISMIQLFIFSIIPIFKMDWFSLGVIFVLGTIFNMVFIYGYARSVYAKDNPAI